MTRKLFLSLAATFALSFLASGCVIVSDDDDGGGYCGDGICDVDYGENDGNCYEDCNPTYICSDMDYWLGTCYPTCTVTWSCEANYDSYDAVTRDDLAYCSTCLADDAEAGICDAGCSVGGVDCEDFLADLLDVDCWKK